MHRPRSLWHQKPLCKESPTLKTLVEHSSHGPIPYSQAHLLQPQRTSKVSYKSSSTLQSPPQLTLSERLSERTPVLGPILFSTPVDSRNLVTQRSKSPQKASLTVLEMSNLTEASPSLRYKPVRANAKVHDLFEESSIKLGELVPGIDVRIGFYPRRGDLAELLVYLAAAAATVFLDEPPNHAAYGIQWGPNIEHRPRESYEFRPMERTDDAFIDIEQNPADPASEHMILKGIIKVLEIANFARRNNKAPGRWPRIIVIAHPYRYIDDCIDQSGFREEMENQQIDVLKNCLEEVINGLEESQEKLGLEVKFWKIDYRENKARQHI